MSPRTRPGDDATLARERGFWNARYVPGPPSVYGWDEFRNAITPAYMPGGAPGGLVHRRAYELLLAGGVAGRCILDYACGQGGLAVHLAQLGAIVRGFDLSESGIRNARARAEQNSVSNIRLDVSDARALPYEDATFDAVIGFSALEHVVKYGGSSDELRRVMKPDAVAYFTENYGQNALINLARRFTMRGQEDAGDVLLTDRLLASWGGRHFDIEVEGHSILFMAKRIIRRPRLLRAFYSVDCLLFSIAPSLRRFGGECVVILRPK
jgi:SAM-dependent methyltransferase